MGSSVPPATLGSLEDIFTNVVGVVFYLAGFVLFIVIIIGGLKYVTSGGDPQKVQSAQKTLTYAIAGLVVLILAYAILAIIEQLTGAQVTQFKIVQP